MNRQPMIDHTTEELARVLIATKTRIDFTTLCEKVIVALKARKLMPRSEEMMRLRTYGKLQDMVTRGTVDKVGKQYVATEKLKTEYPDL